MAAAIILSGGTGTRLELDGIPKQYIMIDGAPILMHAIRPFFEFDGIEAVVVVAHPAWQNKISEWILPASSQTRVVFAESGSTRQESILSGLRKIEESCIPEDDIVVIHDAARPFVDTDLLERVFEEFEGNDCQGVLPVIPINDTIYHSEDGKTIGAILDRDMTYAGQAPELMRFSQYLQICERADEAELKGTRGTSEIAFKNGMVIKLIPGAEENFKVTTAADLKRACEVFDCDYDEVIRQNGLRSKEGNR